jgi:hypothetical protein
LPNRGSAVGSVVGETRTRRTLWRVGITGESVWLALVISEGVGM